MILSPPDAVTTIFLPLVSHVSAPGVFWCVDLVSTFPHHTPWTTWTMGCVEHWPTLWPLTSGKRSVFLPEGVINFAPVSGDRENLLVWTHRDHDEENLCSKKQTNKKNSLFLSFLNRWVQVTGWVYGLPCYCLFVFVHDFLCLEFTQTYTLHLHVTVCKWRLVNCLVDVYF